MIAKVALVALVVATAFAEVTLPWSQVNNNLSPAQWKPTRNQPQGTFDIYYPRNNPTHIHLRVVKHQATREVTVKWASVKTGGVGPGSSSYGSTYQAGRRLSTLPDGTFATDAIPDTAEWAPIKQALRAAGICKAAANRPGRRPRGNRSKEAPLGSWPGDEQTQSGGQQGYAEQPQQPQGGPRGGFGSQNQYQQPRRNRGGRNRNWNRGY